MVIDDTGLARYRADIGMQHGKIVDIGHLGGAVASRGACRKPRACTTSSAMARCGWTMASLPALCRVACGAARSNRESITTVYTPS
jgi:hypothetical protein